ncbi:cyclin-dependent kinase inhibitor 1-like [Osmerus mordax]|uniref:cyclin-dependent kinase inhibitor 1-like n=1 Tax=Osmerus mordax TaxID=8014 RepID=UPI00350FF379
MESVQRKHVLESSVVHGKIPVHRSGVCRNLFGPIDNDQLSCELKAKLKEIYEQDECRWNFNFETNTPLVGRYQWEELNSSPGLYQELTHVEEKDVRGNVNYRDTCVIEETVSRPFSIEVNQENCFNISNTADSPLIRQMRKPHPNNNTQITDFFVKRKRTLETKGINLNSSLAFATEETPRKRIR